MIPAQCTYPSTAPHRSSTCAGNASTASRSVTFSACADMAVDSATVAARVSGFRSTAATFAPRRTAARATAWPIPLPAPVTTRILPASFIRASNG